MSIELRVPTVDDADELLAFFERVPEGERTFFKERAIDRATVAAWVAPDAPGRRVVAVDGGRIAGQVAVVPLPGWSDHVGELRLIVDPPRRGEGIGRALARRAVIDAIELGLSKLVVEVIASQDGTVAMFEALGFRAEGLLADHVRDRGGHLQDLIVLAHAVEEQMALMAATGIDEALR
jgi:ribosomal protein S18 acetylase RimI-like enzyme